MWIIRVWQHISQELTVKGFKECFTDDDMLWNDSEEEGMLAVSVRTMKTLTVKIETVTLTGKGRYSLTCFVH
jgi:hypothetical protein